MTSTLSTSTFVSVGVTNAPPPPPLRFAGHGGGGVNTIFPKTISTRADTRDYHLTHLLSLHPPPLPLPRTCNRTPAEPWSTGAGGNECVHPWRVGGGVWERGGGCN